MNRLSEQCPTCKNRDICRYNKDYSNFLDKLQGLWLPPIGPIRVKVDCDSYIKDIMEVWKNE